MGISPTNDVKDPFWQVTLFGKVRVSSPRGEPIPILKRKTAVLLGYLCLEPGKVHTRRELSDILWPTLELPERQARLRQELASLTKALGVADEGGPLIITRSNVSVLAQRLVTDLQRFQEACQQHAASEDPTFLIQIVTLFAGELLEEGETLCSEQQEETGKAFEEAAWKLAQLYHKRQQREEAIALLRRLTQRDPLFEDAQLALMQLFSQTNQSAAVHYQYLKWEVAWKEHWGTEPPTKLREQAQALAPVRSESVETKPILRPPVTGWAKMKAALFGI